MIASALAVLSAAVFFYLVFLLKIPWPVSAFVLLPLYLLAVAAVVTRINVLARRSWRLDPAAFDRSPVAELRAATDLLAGLGFLRVGDFMRPSMPENPVRAFRHRDEALIACVLGREKKTAFEFITFLDDGGDLTTTTDRTAQFEPRPFRRRLVIQTDADPVLLLDEHRRGVRYLASHGKNPVAVPEARFVAAAAGRELDLVRFIQSSGFFWPLLHLWWNLTRPDRGYGIPVDGRGGAASAHPSFQTPPNSAAPAPVPQVGTPAASQAAASGAGPGPAAALYRVVFRGAVNEGRSVDQVKENLSAAFKLDAAKADTLFTGLAVMIKSGVDGPTARKYADAFNKAGARVDVEIMSGAAAGSAASVSSDPSRSGLPASPPAVQAAVRTPSPAPGGPSVPSSRPAAEDEELMRFKVQSLLSTDRAAAGKERRSEAIGWQGYAMAISSFLPYVGMLGGTLACMYGWARRRSGGWRIIMLASIGSLLSSLSSFDDAFKILPGMQKRSAVMTVRETEKRLDVLVRAIEAYHERNGKYPETLDRVNDGADFKVNIKDPMSGGKKKMVYQLDLDEQFYYLCSPGPDRLVGTSDDIIPLLAGEENGSGWRQL
jgi:hypothetical protein